jgi:hypothetical protein
MSKAVEGAAMLAGAVGMGVAAFLDPALLATVWFDKVWASLIVGGISMEASAIAGALAQNRGMSITHRQPASLRQVVYGEQRVGGVIIYRSTTGSKHDQYNYVIVITGHRVDSLVNLYLDGRQVYWKGSGPGWVIRNGQGFGGIADDNTHIGPGGAHYNFGGTGHSGIYCEARFGDQSPGDVISGLTANDPNWAADGHGNSPWVAGCCYIYLKIEYNQSLFPGEPEVRITTRGKNDIKDPRTGDIVFTNNWALIVADVLTDPTFGLGDLTSVNEAQLIAAANVCDEQVTLAIGGTESRYCCNWQYDTGTSPGDILQTMMPAAAGRLSRIGGEWYIWPAYWQGPSFTFNATVLTGEVEWTPFRSMRELINRVNGTYIAPNSPWNVAGNLYDANGWYNGMIADQFPFAFTPTNYPQYAHDVDHGYAEDAFLEADSGVKAPYSAGTTYAVDDATVDAGIIYISLVDGNVGNTPATSPTYWLPWSNQLPLQLAQNCVLSVSQAQRCAKITLMRNRQQGSGTFPMALGAWQMQPLDVMQFTFPAYAWTSKQLEIVSTKFFVDTSQEEGGAPSVRFTATVQETAETTYEWTTAEDLPVTDTPSNPSISPYNVDPPSNLMLLSNATTAIIGSDGVNAPRILATWVPSPDVLVVSTQIQYRLEGSPIGAWIDVGTVANDTTSAYISGVVSGLTYDVQIRAIRNNGATSVWVETDGCTAFSPNSLAGTYTIDSGLLSGPYVLSQSSPTEIDMVACTASFGGGTPVNYFARTLTIAAPSAPTWFYVSITDPAQAGDINSPILGAACSTNNVLVGKIGNTYMGAILALPAGGATQVLPGGWPAPGSFQVGP